MRYFQSTLFNPIMIKNVETFSRLRIRVFLKFGKYLKFLLPHIFLNYKLTKINFMKISSTVYFTRVFGILVILLKENF